MLDLQREEEILELLRAKNGRTVKELSSLVFVSESTIRRDLARMESKSIITRTFGGALLKQEPVNEDTSFVLRARKNIDAKKALAQKASELIVSGSSIFIDSSSTCLQIVPFLNRFEGLSIITNGLVLANEILTKTHHTLYLLSGFIQPSYNSILGPLTEKQIASFHCSLCLLSSWGMDEQFGFSEKVIEQSCIKRDMMAHSDRSVFLIDKSKIGTRALAKTCPLNEADVMISDEEFPDELKLSCPKTQFIVVEPTGVKP